MHDPTIQRHASAAVFLLTATLMMLAACTIAWVIWTTITFTLIHLGRLFA